MKFVQTPISGAVVIEPERNEDLRGSFADLVCHKTMTDAGLELDFVRESESWNRSAGTLRGMHYNLPPHEETKLVRCTSGLIYDVILDLRPTSQSYLRWFGTNLSPTNWLAIYIPKGVAHGFQTLEDDSRVFYHLSKYYEPEAGAGVRWNDPAFRIEWPRQAGLIMSDRDASYPDYSV